MKGRIAAGAIAVVFALASPVIALHEGLVLNTYADPVGIPTICYGHTAADVRSGRVATEAECDELLQADMQKALDSVLRCVKIELKPNEAAALVSFTFNVGGGALCTSTMARLANAGAPPAQWCAQMGRWVYGTVAGVKIEFPGLVKRRKAEMALCMGENSG